MRERETAEEGQREREGGRERDRQTENPKLHVVSTEPDTGLDLTNHEIMT